MKCISNESLLFQYWSLEITAICNSQAFNTCHSNIIPLNANKSQGLEDSQEIFWSSESMDSELCVKIFLGHKHQY